jgi:hypothetical protein
MQSFVFPVQENHPLILYFCPVGKFYEIYKRNIYGVIGTLVFHILLLSVFLIADVDMKGNLQEEELLIELPELAVNEDIAEEEQETREQQESEPSPNEASSPLSEPQTSLTNRASNRLAQQNKFFDEDYMKEVENAKQLVSDVNSQLSKEKINMDDIKMPVSTSKGIHPDSIENSVYTGESNIVYYLGKRYHLSLPIPVYLTKRGGKIIVNISVNKQGIVTSAEPQKTPGVNDEQLYLYAKAAASRTIFNADPQAPEPQHGTIHYTFVAQ